MKRARQRRRSARRAGVVASRRHGWTLPRAEKVAGISGEPAPKGAARYGCEGPAMAFTLFTARSEPNSRSGRQPAGRSRAGVPGGRCGELSGASSVDAGVEGGPVLVNAAAGATRPDRRGRRPFDEVRRAGPWARAANPSPSSVRMQRGTRPLTDEEIDAVAAKIVEKVAKASGGSRAAEDLRPPTAVARANPWKGIVALWPTAVRPEIRLRTRQAPRNRPPAGSFNGTKMGREAPCSKSGRR